jgi:hypothetical protein
MAGAPAACFLRALPQFLQKLFVSGFSVPHSPQNFIASPQGNDGWFRIMNIVPARMKKTIPFRLASSFLI